jgi:hypothetical protein
MLQKYIQKLIKNLPKTNEKLKLDLVLDGGVFNGSYLVGALYFLKEMEIQQFIKIERISGCSVGSIVSFLYLIDSLDIMPKLYETTIKNFKKTHNLSILTNLKEHLLNNKNIDIINKINGKLFISYYDIKHNKKRVKSHYKDVDDIIETIIKSCFVPYLINGNILYKNKYIDGINPYIFKKSEKKNKKILYLNLLSYDNLSNILNVKNEKSNHHRILSGLLDIHHFYIKQSKTSICSYVEDWNLFDYSFYYFKKVLEKIIVYCIFFIVYFKIPFITNSFFFHLFKKISEKIGIELLEKYCL